jgi:K+-transporting ATPase KdpF subunit
VYRRAQLVMTILCLVLSVAAFAYLAYAMLRPEQF